MRFFIPSLNKIRVLAVKPLYVSLLLLCFSSFATASQNGGDSINVIKEGKKQGRWKITNAILHRECYADDQVVEEGIYKDSKKDGAWLEYYCNKNLKSKITFVDNRPNGYAIVYHENGKVKEEGKWENNRWVGEYKLYYPNGQVQQAFNYNASGKREGRQVYYYEDGQVMIEGNWSGGKEAGEIKEYYENGDLKSVKTFNGGIVDETKTKTYEPKKPLVEKPRPVENVDVPIVVVDKTQETTNYGRKEAFNGEGYWQLYNNDRQLTKEGIFKKNKLMDGKAYFYDDDGLLIRIAIFKDGKYIGDGVIGE